MDLNDYLDLPANKSSELSVMINQIATMENMLKDMKETKKHCDDMKEKLKEKMKEYNVKKWETPSGIKCTLVEDIEPRKEESKQFNEAKFKLDHKDMWLEYLQEVIEEIPGKKGYVRVTLPKE